MQLISPQGVLVIGAFDQVILTAHLHLADRTTTTGDSMDDWKSLEKNQLDVSCK